MNNMQKLLNRMSTYDVAFEPFDSYPNMLRRDEDIIFTAFEEVQNENIGNRGLADMTLFLCQCAAVIADDETLLSGCADRAKAYIHAMIDVIVQYEQDHL